MIALPAQVLIFKPELGSLSNLTELDLHDNNLSGGIPAELGSLSNLTRLELGNNELSGEIPAELGSLSNLPLQQGWSSATTS